MKEYKIDYEMKSGDYDTLDFVDEEEAIEVYEDLKSDSECEYAILKEFLIYGGICQAENVIDEFTK